MFGYMLLLLLLPALALSDGQHSDLEAKLFSQMDTDGDGKLQRSEHDSFYSAFDLDKSGEVTKDELKTVIANLDPMFVGHEDALYKLLDRDGNNRIDKADIESVFTVVDVNKDGFIDKGEYHVIFRNILKAIDHNPTTA